MDDTITGTPATSAAVWYYTVKAKFDPRNPVVLLSWYIMRLTQRRLRHAKGNVA